MLLENHSKTSATWCHFVYEEMLDVQTENEFLYIIQLRHWGSWADFAVWMDVLGL